MELRYQREATVGAFLIGATLLFVFGLMWLRGLSLRRGEILAVAFSDVVGLKVGDPVRTSGVGIGTVKTIRLERPGRVVVQLELTQRQQPRTDAQAIVRSLDFFGARYIDFQPGTAGPLPEDSAISGAIEPGFGEMAQTLTTQGRRVLDNAAELVGHENNQQLRAAIARAQRLLDRLGGSVDTGTGQGIRTLQELWQVLHRMDVLLADPATQRSVANVQELTGNLADASATLRHTSVVLDSLLTKVNAGRGTMGQLVNDPSLLLELRQTNRHLDSLLTDFMANPRKYINVHVF